MFGKILLACLMVLPLFGGNCVQNSFLRSTPPSPNAFPVCNWYGDDCTAQPSYCMTSAPINTVYNGTGSFSTICNGTCSSGSYHGPTGGQGITAGAKSTVTTSKCITEKGKSKDLTIAVGEVYKFKGCPGTGVIDATYEADFNTTFDASSYTSCPGGGWNCGATGQYCGIYARISVGNSSPDGPPYWYYETFYIVYCDGGSLDYYSPMPPPAVATCMTPITPTIAP